MTVQLPTDYQNFIHKTRYARFRDDLGRRENWDETVTRYFDHFESDLEERHGYKVPRTLRSELYDAVLKLEIVPSMRAMMTAGPALKRENIAGYNCSYLEYDRPRAFAECLYILMCGTGVGFSVERQVIKKLPEVPNEFTKVDKTIVIGDSKLGWSKGFDELIACLYAGEVPNIDYSLIRKAGERLKIFGGRASGPEPLRQLYDFTIKIFRDAKGRKLHSTEVHEIACKTGDIVVVGGVRRSALISISNLSDLRMRDIKSGNWFTDKPHLQLANNSAGYTEKPDVGIFMDEWAALYRSKSGERGIFNRYGAEEKVQRLGRREHGYAWGTNPCVTGDTMIPTRKGWFPISQLEGKTCEVWNGVRWSTVTPYSTGLNETSEILFSDGTSIKATDYHGWAIHGPGKTGEKKQHPTPGRGRTHYRKVMTSQLKPGMSLSKFDLFDLMEGVEPDPKIDAYSQGFYSGDGNKNSTGSWVYEPKYAVIPRLVGTIKEALPEYNRRDWKHGEMLPKNFVPLNHSLDYRINWLAGLLDADGCCVQTKEGSDSIQIFAVDREFLMDVKRLILGLGSHCQLSLAGEGGFGFIGEDNGSRAFFKPTHRLTVSPYETQNILSKGLKTNRLEFKEPVFLSERRRYVTIVSVTPYSQEETFCYTEVENGLGMFEGIVGPQCGEIILRDRELCNLSEAIVRENDSVSSMLDKVRLASVLGTWQSTQTSFNFVEPEWQKNCEEERLLGVSLTGIYDNAMMRGDSGLDKLSIKLQKLKSEAIKSNRLEAKVIGIPASVAITTNKPSGTVSQLALCPSGIHQGHSPFHIRGVSQDNKDPVTQFMVDSGFAYEPHYSKPQDMTFFKFPTKLAAHTVTRDEVTAIQHMELVKCYNQNWSEHAVSCTISIRESEWPAVGGWVYDNFDDLAGMSFLPHFEADSSYPQLPYTTCTEAEYNEALDKQPKNIDWSKMADYEKGEDTVAGTREFACVGNTCELIESVRPT